MIDLKGFSGNRLLSIFLNLIIGLFLQQINAPETEKYLRCPILENQMW